MTALQQVADRTSVDTLARFVDEQVEFAAALAPVGGVRPGQLTPFSPGR